jgi:hypothetical protein
MKYLTTTEINRMNEIANTYENMYDANLYEDYDLWCELFAKEFGDDRLEELEEEHHPFLDWVEGFPGEVA